MSLFRNLIFCCLLAGAPVLLTAQPFFGYQTIGVHTWYFSLNWDGTQPQLGVGYNGRITHGGFADIGAEWRAPLTQLFAFDEQTFIVGAYGPARLRRRPFIGGGLHVRLHTLRSEQRTRLSLAATVLPSYTYAASLGNGPYGTAGLRLTYVLGVYDKAAAAPPTWLPTFGAELGAHLDLHLERTLGLSLDAFAARQWPLRTSGLPADDMTWTPQGSLYTGSTYYLRRW
ncbi:MAG: hypothetical protein OHK0039_32420 [Bacteroidia bacterium]